jgi:hypothetical protein
MRKLLEKIILAGLLVVVTVAICSAEMYRWVDKNGVVGFADSLQKIPPEYRDSAKRVDGTGPSSGTSRKPFQVVPAIPPSGIDVPGGTDNSYTVWQERIREARQELEQLKTQRLAVQKEYDSFRGELFKRGRADPDADTKLQAQIADLDQQIAEKEMEIGTTIPDEARRAGIPPELLR